METERELRSDVNSMLLAHLTKLLIKKGLITEAEFMQGLLAERSVYQAMLRKMS